MFCYQCEQTAKGEGCTKIGVCGKQPEVSDLQDLLIYALKGLAMVAAEGRRVGITDSAVNVFTVKSLFSTLTNVNFDEKYFLEVIARTVKLREDQEESLRGRRQDRLYGACGNLHARTDHRGAPLPGSHSGAQSGHE